MKVACPSETYVDFQWTIRRYILDDRTLQTKTLVSYMDHYFIEVSNLIYFHENKMKFIYTTKMHLNNFSSSNYNLIGLIQISYCIM
jgi:hypothetical protein